MTSSESGSQTGKLDGDIWTRRPHLRSILNPRPPVIKAVTQKNKKKQSHSQRCSSKPGLTPDLRNEAWHRLRSETKQWGSAWPERGRSGDWHCVFLTTAKIRPRCTVTSVKHWSRWLPATGEHSQEASCAYCQFKANDREGITVTTET